jgi:hypothetical protein
MRGRVTALLAATIVAAATAPVAAGRPDAATAAVAARTVTLKHGQRIYRGTGNRALGTLQLTRTARLTWRHPRGGPLRLLTSASHGRRFVLLTTTARTGSVTLGAGAYRSLRLQARGGWRLTITTLK